MSFGKIHSKLDNVTKAAFIRWISAKGHGNQYGMVYGRHSFEKVYHQYICVDAPNQKGFSSALLKEMRKMELLAQHDISSETKNSPDDITDREYGNNTFIRSAIKSAVKECDETLTRCYSEFVDSNAYKQILRKSIDGAKLAKDIGLPKKVEKDLVEGAVAAKTRDKAGTQKVVQGIVKKYGNEIPKKLNNVKDLIAALEKNSAKNGTAPIFPK